MEPPQKGTNKKAVSGKENNLQTYTLLPNFPYISALQRVAKGEIKQYKGWKCRYETILLT
jgi:hypothetical protein